MLASGGMDTTLAVTIILWNVTNPKSPTQLSVLSAHMDAVIDVTFSADSKILQSASRSTVISWNVTNPKSPTQLSVLSAGLNYPSNSFSGDRKILAIPDGETIILWDSDVESWKRSACQIVRRNLTKTEWNRYMGAEPYRKTCEEFEEGE